MDLEHSLQYFAADLQLSGRSDRTIREHVKNIRRLASWCEESSIEWREMTRAELKTYARLFAHLGFSSRSNVFCSLRRFFGWAVEEGHLANSPAQGFKTPTRPGPIPKALTLDQVAALTSYLTEQSGLTARRNEALVLFGLYTGMRSKELAELRWSDIDFQQEVIVITLSKGRHGRVLPMHDVAHKQLAIWRALQSPAGDWPVFSLNGKPLSPVRPGKIVRLVSKASGVKLTAHILRHTFATWMLRRSHDLYAVSKALGHKKLEQTEIYVSADPEYFRSAVDALSF